MCIRDSSDINKQSFCPSVGGQESAGIPLVKIGNMIPVSYTHLDVYKRQGKSFFFVYQVFMNTAYIHQLPLYKFTTNSAFRQHLCKKTLAVLGLSLIHI